MNTLARKSLIPSLALTIISSQTDAAQGTGPGQDQHPAAATQANTSPIGSRANPVKPDTTALENYDTLDHAMKQYIRKHYQEYQIRGESYTMRGDRYIHTFGLAREGETKLTFVSFDVTDAYAGLKDKGRHNRGQIKQLMEKHLPGTTGKE